MTAFESMGNRRLQRTATTILATCILLTARIGTGQQADPVGESTPLERGLRLALVPEEPIPLPPVAASDGHGLTMSAAESLAMSRHPALREAEGMVRAARGNWLQVGLRPNPEIGYSGVEIGDEGQAGQQGGFVSQQFVTAHKLDLNRAVAAREVAAAEQQYMIARLRLITTVRQYYFETLAAERAVALAQQLTRIAAQSVQVADMLLRAEEGSRASLLQSQIQSESAILLEQQAQNRREAAWRRLATLLGVELEARQSLEDTLLNPLPELDWESTRARLLSESPELAGLRFEVERARWAVERARAGRVPNVDLQAGVAQDNATQDTIANVQVSMPIPLFNRNQGAIAEACGQLAAAQAALDQRELVLQQRLATALRDYQTARQRVARYAETILPTARESLDIISRAYEQGELDYLQVLTVQQTYTEKHLSYLDDLEIAWKQWAQIDGLLVGPLPDGRN